MVVCHFEATVLEKAHQRILLSHAVAECRAQQAALVFHPFVGILGEREESDDVRPEMTIAQRLALIGIVIPPASLELEHTHDARKPLARDRCLCRESGITET